MSKKPLTSKQIENLRPHAERYEVRDGSSHLYLCVYPSGEKSFLCRYRFGGRKKKTTLDGLELAEARKRASEWMYDVGKGIDPAIEAKAAKRKEADAAADTVQAICEEYLKLEGRGLRTVERRRKDLARLAYPEIGSEPVETITRSRITRLLDKIRADGHERTADLILAYLHTAFEWHEARSDTFRNPITKKMHTYKPADHARERVLTDDEIRAVWKATERDDPASAYIRFLLLTGARRTEAAGLPWDEITGDLWTLPADAGPDRNKTKKDLVRPLSKAALAIVEAQPHGDGPLVFSNDGRKMLAFGLLKKNVDTASGVKNWTLHDLRRTARTLLSRADVNVDLAELCIGHVKRGVRAVYDRHDFIEQMRPALEKLAARIDIIVNPPKGNVISVLAGRSR